MSSPPKYFFLPGSHPVLSYAEIADFLDAPQWDKKINLIFAKDILWDKAILRSIPKPREQLFLDRLGGTVYFGEIIKHTSSLPPLFEAVKTEVSQLLPHFEAKVKLGFSVFGAESAPVLQRLYALLSPLASRLRIENPPHQNISSGTIFDRRVLQKGAVFCLIKHQSQWYLGKILANQNLRNYTLRDRKKPFRDSKMGMLPPKLAQMLINFTHAPGDRLIVDPFCGSGTVNIEAALMGYRTLGMDKNPAFIEGAKKNFLFLAEKFRYPPESGTFFPADARALGAFLPPQKSVLATEGFLGKNFERPPSAAQVAAEKSIIRSLWQDLFQSVTTSPLETLSFALPFWRVRSGISLREELEPIANKAGFQFLPLFDGQKSYVYFRQHAFVGREICVAARK